MESDLRTCRTFVVERHNTRGTNRKVSKLFNKTECLSGLAATLVGRFVYVMGGSTSAGGTVEGVFVLDSSTWTWSEWVEGVEKELVEHANMVLVNDKIYAFGGEQPGNTALKLYVMDIPLRTGYIKRSFNEILIPYGTSAGEYIESLGLIVVFGGYRAAEPGSGLRYILTNRLVGYDLASNVWKLLRVRGTIPPAKQSHDCCKYGAYDLFFFSGADFSAEILPYIYHLSCCNGFVWSKLSHKPTGLRHYSVCCIGNRVIIYGGIDEHGKKSNALRVYSLVKRRNDQLLLREKSGFSAVPMKLKVDGKLATSAFHAAVASSNRIVILGGEFRPVNIAVVLTSRA